MCKILILKVGKSLRFKEYIPSEIDTESLGEVALYSKSSSKSEKYLLDLDKMEMPNI